MLEASGKMLSLDVTVWGVVKQS